MKRRLAWMMENIDRVHYLGPEQLSLTDSLCAIKAYQAESGTQTCNSNFDGFLILSSFSGGQL